jgi:uncharacterized membrane protein
MAFAAALGCGLIAGVFFAFSAFVMKALSRLPAAQGIAAMQSINTWAVTPVFMTALFGTGGACLALAAVAIATWGDPGRAYLLAGATAYLIGTILVTIACNVPRNNALAAATPESPASARLWTNYLTTWTAWNHVRTLASLAAAALLALALVQMVRKFP